MFPVLLSIGPFHIFSLSIFLVLSWLVFSFLFWRQLRAQGVEEDRIFDLTYYATLAAFVSARLLYVALHFPLFADNYLKIPAIWVTPGLSFLGAVIGGVVTLLLLSRSLKVRMGYVVDAVALSLPAATMVGLVGSFLDGSVVGKQIHMPLSIRYVGHVGLRHPVQLYEAVVLLVVMGVLLLLQRQATKQKWPHGLLGVWFFFFFSLMSFGLEFVRDGDIYWKSLSANQWIALALFCEVLGAFYVRGGVREMVRPAGNTVKRSIQKTLGGIYERLRHKKH